MERMNIIIVSIVLMFFFNYVVVYPAFGILQCTLSYYWRDGRLGGLGENIEGIN